MPQWRNGSRVGFRNQYEIIVVCRFESYLGYYLLSPRLTAGHVVLVHRIEVRILGGKQNYWTLSSVGREQLAHNEKVTSSSLVGSTIKFFMFGMFKSLQKIMESFDSISQSDAMAKVTATTPGVKNFMETTKQEGDFKVTTIEYETETGGKCRIVSSTYVGGSSNPYETRLKELKNLISAAVEAEDYEKALEFKKEKETLISKLKGEKQIENKGDE